MAVFSIIFAAVTSRVGAATYGVTTPGQQTLTNRFLPYAGSGTQLIGNSPAWRDSAGVLGINNYLEGLETLTPAAAVNLNFSTWRTKRITLNQNTIFTAINIPSASTNVQTMLLEVIGDGAFTVSFANVTWQTPEITTPDAGVVTLYALRGDSGAVKGYTQAVAASGVTTINPTDGYLPYRSNATTFANSPLITVITNVANTGNFLLLDGNETYPSYSFTNGPTVGYFRDATGASAFSEGGAQIARLTLGALDLKTNMVIGWSELPGLQSSDWTMAANSTGFVWGFQASIKGKIDQNSGYTGTGANFLSDDGTYKAAGGGTTINPTDGYLPYRSNATTFADSPLIVSASTNVSNIGRYLSLDGLETNPTYSFTNATGLGYFRDGTGASGFAEGGSQIARLTTSAFDITTNSFIGWSRLPGTTTSTVTIGLTNSSGGNGDIVFAANSAWTARINQNSGYTGAGTLFLSDDGTYKAGSGFSFWSSSSGNLTPSPAVDVVSIQSQSADSATNIALVVDTATPWTTDLSKLQVWRNNGTNIMSFGSFGGNRAGLSIGDNSSDLRMFFESGGADSTAEIYTAGNGLYDFDLYAAASSVYLELTAGTNYLTRLQPTIADGSTPYLFRTSVSHTSGNLLEIANNGTNKVTVDFEGSVVANSFTAGSTNLVGELAGKVTGAASSTDNDLMTFSSTSGKLAKVSTSAGTLGDNSSATYALTFNVSGTDPVLTAGSATLTSSAQVIVPDGSASTPGLRGSDADSGLVFDAVSSGRVTIVAAGTQTYFFDSAKLNINALNNCLLLRNVYIGNDGGTEVFQIGADAAIPTAQTAKGPDGSGSDKAGGNLTLGGGKSTGTGRGGDLITATSLTAAGTSSTQNALSTRYQAVAKAVDLTGGAATAFQKFTLATNNYAGMEIVATVRASDAAFAMQSLTSVLKIDAVNVGGTNNVQVTQVDNTLAQIPAGGTLTCTYDAIDEGGNVFSIRANAASSLTETILRVKWVITALNSSDAITVTPQ